MGSKSGNSPILFIWICFFLSLQLGWVPHESLARMGYSPQQMRSTPPITGKNTIFYLANVEWVKTNEGQKNNDSSQ
jgi:hypothetical protein